MVFNRDQFKTKLSYAEIEPNSKFSPQANLS